MTIINAVQATTFQSMKIAKLFFYISTMFFIPLISITHAGDLIVVVENIKSDQGNVRAAVFNNAKDFTKTPLLGQFISAKVGAVTFTFKNLPSGQYAVSTFHDMNANKKLDTNFVGKPVEPYGFSRDARGTFGPPSFEDAIVQIDEAIKTVTILVK